MGFAEQRDYAPRSTPNDPQSAGYIQPANNVHVSHACNNTNTGDTPKALLSMNNLPEELKYELFIAAELYTLRVAYPVQARKFTEREVSRTNELWAETFAGVDLGLLHKAIMRFIDTDRKAFFPSPGQVIGILKDIMAEEEAERKHIAAERHRTEVLEMERRIAQGENCSTCSFCEHRQIGVGSNGLDGLDDLNDLDNFGSHGNVSHSYVRHGNFSRSKDFGGHGSFNHHKRRDNGTKLFCQNPDSYKYEGKSGHGTTATILCEYYAPIAQPEGK
jgi:hypothetical protein